MAMLQSLALSVVMFLQMMFGLIFVAPPAKAPPVDYGGDPYVQTVIGEPMTLVAAGATDYAIVYPANAAADVITGVAWLQDFIEQMTGVRLNAVADGLIASADAGKYIFVGDTRLTPAALTADLAALPNEGFLKRVIGDDVFLAGQGRGTMYSCSSFLEEQLGCHWFTPELKTAPQKADIVVDKKLDSTQSSQLVYRDVYWQTSNRSPEWKAFNKVNSGMGSYIGAEFGYGINYVDFCHSMERLVPAEHYGEHPEYFSWRTDKNAWTTEQRCLTNPEVLRITIESCIRKIGSTGPDFTIMSVTQNDNGGYCQCANCAAKDAELGGPAGTNIWFANQVADAVKEAFPGREMYIDTFAYDYTTAPPTKIVPGVNTPRDNVIVRLCSIGCCFAHPIAECGHGKGESVFDNYKEKESQFADYIKGWSELCTNNNLFIWDYTTNFKTYSMPFPNFQVFSDNIQFFLENKVMGLFEQGNYDGGNHSPEFGEMRAYVLAKLMWTPKANVAQLMNEFMSAYYGEASAPFVKSYLDFITRRTIDTSHLFIFSRPESNTYFSTADLMKCDKWWDEAEKLATDPWQLENIQRSRLSLRHYKANMMKLEFNLLNPKRMELNKQLFEDTVMLGIDKMREMHPLAEPYNDYVWWLRPIEWGDPIAWVLFVEEDKVIPMDLEAYREAHQK